MGPKYREVSQASLEPGAKEQNAVELKVPVLFSGQHNILSLILSLSLSLSSFFTINYLCFFLLLQTQVQIKLPHTWLLFTSDLKTEL